MSSPASTTGNPTHPRKSMRVLYADDMRELRQLLEIVLGRDGHKVDSVHDGKLALEILKKDLGAYDVVITDHHMPSISGLELVGELRAIKYPGRIIVFSSELSTEVDAAYRRHRVDHILPKPIFPSDLRAIFATL
ncbi:Sensory/regulatory protein RpfC [Lacunisphaera limnophila]|uniref:Sensory/regulatory protein RpfC n=1 Tax=Lacunisphaera limnophila TaxID=1838286 RepID=A0A1D8AR00_9BACT|nr:response regulator [Lacunisphaera limnophila]AOS43174.1 Sensory/regulatory protein RpfC [Lacunisphaera limnophila]